MNSHRIDKLNTQETGKYRAPCGMNSIVFINSKPPTKKDMKKLRPLPIDMVYVQFHWNDDMNDYIQDNVFIV